MDKLRKNSNDILIVVISIINFIAIYMLDYECPWKKNFGIDCAGCGVMRMLISMIHLDFYQAFRFNPLFFLLIVFFFLYIVYVLICKIRRVTYYHFSVNILWVLLILVVGFMILRNIPGLECLRPTYVS